MGPLGASLAGVYVTRIAARVRLALLVVRIQRAPERERGRLDGESP
jgi:hypothetical protein